MPVFCFVLLILALILPGQVRAEIRYETDFSAMDEAGLEGAVDIIRDLSQLEIRKEQTIESVSLLRRRATGDVQRIRDVLRSEGYYDSRIRFEIEEPEDDAAPVRVILELERGPVYRLESFVLSFATQEQERAADGISYESLGVTLGERARADMIVSAERQVVNRLGRKGYPFARSVDRDIVVDHETRSVAATLELDAGQPTVFGALEIDGLSEVDAAVVRREIRWKEGEPYDVQKVTETRQALSSLDLFTSVNIRADEQQRQGETVPMTVALTESPARSIGGGVKYSTSEGLGVNAFWRHRNFFGHGEELRVEGQVSEQVYGADIKLGKPAFLDNDNRLDLGVYARDERFDAYDAQRFGAGGTITRQFGGPYSGSAGVTLEQSRITDETGINNFTLIGFPVTGQYDTTNDLLNPTSGGRLRLAATPYAGLIGGTANFTVLRADDTVHYALDSDEKYILAGRLTVGSILGATRTDVPADKRFHAGGGDTVRGYGFQSVGPRDAENNPTGGSSMIAGSVEFRARVWEDIGLVTFLDGGNVYRSELPDLGEKLLFGAGVGLRYYTPIGPLRFDIAVPLDKREDDSSFQIYISLGQAF